MNPDYVYSVDQAKVTKWALQPAGEREEGVKLFDDDTFNLTGNMARYVREIAKPYKKKSTDAAGNVYEVDNKGAFLNDRGEIEVTPTDASTYMNSNPDVRTAYVNRVDWLIGNEVLGMQKTGLYPWMEGKNFAELKAMTEGDPAKYNALNPASFAERLIEEAQEDLRSSAKNDLNQNIDYTAKKMTEAKESVGERKDAKNVEDANYTIKEIIFLEKQSALNTLFNQSESYKNPRFSPTPGKGWKGKGDTLIGPPDPDAPNKYILLDIWDKGENKDETV